MKKIILGLLVFVAGIFLTCNFIKVKAAATVTLTEGASIRTDSHAGMKFQATVSEAVEGASYGMVFGKGVVADLTVESTGAVTAEVDSLDENMQYRVTMVNFPESAYAQDVTVRAYIRVGEEYTYSENIVTRNLAQLALNAKNRGMSSVDEESNPNLIANVEAYVAANYKKSFTDAQGSVYYDGPIFETYHKALGVEFIRDWNSKFETTLDASTAFVTSSYDSPFRQSAKNSSTTSPEGSNLAEFFRDEELYAKWGWILEYISEELTAAKSVNGSKDAIGYDPCMTQIKCILENTTDESGNWYYGYTLVSYLQSIFNGVGTSAGSGQYKFQYNLDKLALIANYNTTIYANLDYSKLVKNESTQTLPEKEKAGYTFSWLCGESSYESGAEVILEASSNYVFVQNYEAISYSVKFYNGENELTELSTTYNVENSLALPELEVEGFDFHGWYEDSEFSGDAVSTISEGSIGNKVYYAKLTEKLYEEVTVTFDANGGVLSPSVVNGVSTFTVSSYSNTGLASDIYMCDTGVLTNNSLRWQKKILLKYNSEYDLYEVVVVDAATASANNAASAAGVTWTHAFAGSATVASAGQYVYLDVAALKAGTAQTAKVFNSLDAFTGYTATLKEPEELSVPSQYGYKFLGWKSSVDGSVVTEYPGYKTNPGAITYTAQWEDILFDIQYELDGGELGAGSPTEYWLGEGVALVNPTKLNHEFLGWSLEAGSTEYISSISTESTDTVTLYANWKDVSEQVTEVQLTEADLEVIESQQPTKFVSADFAGGIYLINEVEYVFGENAFNSIVAALEVADEAEVIYVFAGTYADALTISVANVTLAGPNYGVKGNGTRNAEANITGLTDIAAEGVTVNGFKFTESANVKISASNIILSNSYVAPSANISPAGNATRAAVVVSGVSTKLTSVSILDNYLDTPGTTFNITNESIVLDSVENCVISGNYITNSKTTAAGTNYASSSAMIRLYTVAGTLNIYNNEFAWATTGYAIEIANNANSCTEINIKENVFDNNGLYATNAGINIRKGSSSCVTNVIGNKFYNITGSTILASGDTGSTINVKYNLFGEGTSYKTGGIGSATLVFSNNYYALSTQTTTTSDFDTYTHDADGLAAYEAAYAAYKAQ